MSGIMTFPAHRNDIIPARFGISIDVMPMARRVAAFIAAHFGYRRQVAISEGVIKGSPSFLFLGIGAAISCHRHFSLFCFPILGLRCFDSGALANSRAGRPPARRIAPSFLIRLEFLRRPVSSHRLFSLRAVAPLLIRLFTARAASAVSSVEPARSFAKLLKRLFRLAFRATFCLGVNGHDGLLCRSSWLERRRVSSGAAHLIYPNTIYTSTIFSGAI